jgi:hypothetical protein
MSEVTKALDFYMGKNTPERKTFIVDNLITESERTVPGTVITLSR